MNPAGLIITPDSLDFAAYLAESEPHAKVLPATAWREELIDVVENGNHIYGAKLPWAKTHDLIRFRGGEVTLWQGINGHGKSQLLGMVALGFAAQGESVCIASFEMTPKATLYRMLRQVAQSGNPSSLFANEFIDWLTGKFWIYNQMGSATPEMLAAVIRYCADRLQIKHVVIDSLMRVVKGEDDYNRQKDFVGLLCSLARDYNLHIHLVHHVRKMESEFDVPGKFHSKGSGAITDQVDQVLTVWRNKKKEREIEKLIHNRNVPDEILAKSDALLICDKNRHGDWEGDVKLWFHPVSLQYTANMQRQPIDLMRAIG